ncbi:MAG: DNA polymerase III subunit gamma/tau [Cyanobacteria bacterium REEB67]|nr:DNA polymerase III subunit gamma/tau [Cyanobacteria bacterium REEB67]
MESYQPLYLKHRPQTLGQLVGQGTVVKTLTNAIDNDRIAHAYLFTGPRGCGKTSSARILAKSLNCENGPTAEPCMTCTMCEEIKKGISPAVMEIDAASNNSVDDARVIIERAPLVAQGGRFKLYIIDECHMLTKEAFNALLKTIEEPPPNVIFILATTEEHKVPPTIISRCQRLMFRLVNHDDLCAHLRAVADLEKITIEDQAIELIARRSGGGARDALGLLDQASLLSSPEKPVGIKDLLTLLGAIEEDVLLKISEGIANRDGESVLSAVHQLLAQGREPSLVALELAKHFLNLAKGMHLANTKGSSAGGSPETLSLAQQLITGSGDYIEKVISLARSFEGSELTQIVMELDRLEQSLRRSTQPSLALEVGLLAVCHRHDILLVKELARKVELLESAVSGGPPLVMPAHSAAHATAAHAPSHAPAPAYAAAQAAPPRPAATPTYSAAPAAPPTAQAAPPLPKTPAPPAPGPTEPDNWTPVGPATELAKTAPDQGVDADGDVEPPINRAEDGDEDEEQEDIASAAAAKMQAAGAAATAASAPAAVPSLPPPGRPDGDGDGDGEDVDEFWSNLMTEMQGHIPSYSLVSQFGFPISLRGDELVIGVMKDNFQKMLEDKADRIKAAAKIILGRDILVRVRVTNQDKAPGGGAPGPKPVNAGGNPPPSAPAHRPPPPPPPTSPAPRPASGDSNLPNAPAQQAAPASNLRAAAPPPSAQKNAAAVGNSEFAPSPSSSSKPSSADLSRPGPSIGANPSENQLMVKEAYKLFEGPGSRFVG